MNKKDEEVREILSERVLEKILLKVKEKEIEIKDVKGIMSKIVEGLDFEEAIKVEKIDDNEIEEAIRKIVRGNPGLRPNAYMGLVMAKFKGKFDTKKAMEVLHKVCANNNS